MKQQYFLFLIYISCLSSSLLFFSCSTSTSSSEKILNTINSGQLTIGVDATFKPLVATCIETFEVVTPKATVIPNYQPQEQAFTNLVDGTLDLIITGRSLTDREERIVKEKGLKPKVTVIAYDALAFITSTQSTFTTLSINRIKSILTGGEKGLIVCDESNSGNLMFLKDKCSIDIPMMQIFAAGSDSAIVDYVANHPESIGVVGLSFISDYDDHKVTTRFEKIKPLTLHYKDSLGIEREGYPVQEQLFTKDYPFIREIFVVNLDGQTNLGTGFANFLISERGQRIVLKLGLLPFYMPTRNILIKTNSNN